MAEAGEDQPKRCHCGFWGSPQTMNLCSKCYQDHLQKVKASKADGGGQSSQLLEQLGLFRSDTSEESTDNLVKKEEVSEDKKEEEGGDVFLPVERPVQKNKKRCWSCKTKLELAQRELGGCKCGYVFCFLHRLPEQHSCIYDHKEGGRQEAMKSMVNTGRKKIGRSFHRMDSRPE